MASLESGFTKAGGEKKSQVLKLTVRKQASHNKQNRFTMTSQVTVQRDVRRKHCTKDELGKIDGAKLALLAAW